MKGMQELEPEATEFDDFIAESFMRNPYIGIGEGDDEMPQWEVFDGEKGEFF